MTSQVQRVNFFGAFAILLTMLRQRSFVLQLVKLQLLYQFLPMVALWLLMAASASTLHRQIAQRDATSWNLHELLALAKPILWVSGSGFLIVLLLTMWGFVKSGRLAIHSLTPMQTPLRPRYLGPVFSLVLGTFIILALVGLMGLLLPVGLQTLLPILAIYAYATVTVAPFIALQGGISPFKAAWQALSLGYVAQGQSKVSCVFSLLNFSIIAYFITATGFLLTEAAVHKLFLQHSAILFDSLSLLSIDMSRVAFLVRIPQGVFLSLGMVVISAGAAITYLLAQRQIPTIQTQV